MDLLKNITRKYYPVNALINYDGVVLKVVPQKDNKPSCTGCYFNKWTQEKRGKSVSCSTHAMSCTASVRKDKQHVIFKPL